MPLLPLFLWLSNDEVSRIWFCLQTVAEEHKIDAMPTFVFLKNGKEIDRVVGAKKEALVELVEKLSVEPAASS